MTGRVNYIAIEMRRIPAGDYQLIQGKRMITCLKLRSTYHAEVMNDYNRD